MTGKFTGRVYVIFKKKISKHLIFLHEDSRTFTRNVCCVEWWWMRHLHQAESSTASMTMLSMNRCSIPRKMFKGTVSRNFRHLVFSPLNGTPGSPDSWALAVLNIDSNSDSIRFDYENLLRAMHPWCQWHCWAVCSRVRFPLSICFIAKHIFQCMSRRRHWHRCAINNVEYIREFEGEVISWEKKPEADISSPVL
jgi:hypothetical protein